MRPAGVLAALPSVGLLGMLTTACPCAAKLRGWAFWLEPRTSSVSMDAGAKESLIIVTSYLHFYIKREIMSS